MIKIIHISLLFFLPSVQLIAQTIFYEDFSTCSNSGVTTSGTDNVGGVAWSTFVPGSIASSDYLMCVGGKLEGKDTNGEAEFVTGVIDVSSCVGSELSFTLEESGDMEDCTDCGGTGSNCVDYVYAEYNLDGGGWTGFFTGTTCGLTLTSGKELSYIGDIPGGGPITWTSSCIDYGEELEIRIFVSTWAGEEEYRIDDVTVGCNDCILPIELVGFKVDATDNVATLNWMTMSEHSNDHFIIERSFNGKEFKVIGQVDGAGNSSELLNYSYIDRYPVFEPEIFYRIKQVDHNGQFSYSDVKAVYQSTVNISYTNNQLHISALNSGGKQLTYRIYSISGQLISNGTFEDFIQIPWTKNGMFIVEIPELRKHQKVVCPTSF